MGLGADELKVLVSLRKSGHLPPSPSVIEIGTQQLAAQLLRSPEIMAEAASAFGVSPRDFGKAEPRRGGRSGPSELEPLDPNAPFARDLWEWLGFSYASIDIDGSPGSIPLDLNFDEVPTNLIGRYDVVTNIGTTEHVANQLQAMKIIHDLCALGGVMLHAVPAQGMLTHGLVNYTPKFFWMLARSNAYKWLYADMMLYEAVEPLSNDIVGEMAKFPTDFDERSKRYRTGDGCLLIVLQKWLDIPYVPPIDVPSGAEVTSPEIRDRYWTVFDDARLQKLIAERTS